MATGSRQAGVRFMSECDELTDRLNKLNIDRDISETRAILRRIFALSNADVTGTHRCLTAVVKHLASSDIITKKLSAWFISRHSHQYEDVFLLAINTLVKDTSDPNPLIRALALKTITSVDTAAVAGGRQVLEEYGLPAAVRGLADASAVVRRAAILACVRLSTACRDLLLEQGIVDHLYALIRDPDPIVLVNALCVLEEILTNEGGVVINQNIANYLLGRLKSIPERSLPYVLTIISKYVPTDRARIADIMNVLDPYLRSACPSVVLHTVSYFRYLAYSIPAGEKEEDGYVAKLDDDIIAHVTGHLAHLLGACSDSETTLSLLDFICSLLPKHAATFKPHHRLFYCRPNDPVYLKLKKIHSLGEVCGEESIDETLDELTTICQDQSTCVARQSIMTLGRLCVRYPACTASVIRVCTRILDQQAIYKDEGRAISGSVISDVLDVMNNVNLTTLPDFRHVFESIERCAFIASSGGQLESHDDDKCHHRDLTDKCSLAAILSTYGRYIDSAPYILERYIDQLEEELGLDDVSPCRQHQDQTRLLEAVLSAAVTLFLDRPAECQEILGRALQLCVQSGDTDLSDRASFYYRLLHTDVNMARSIVLRHTDMPT